MYTLNGWWFLSSGGSYPPVFMVDGAHRLHYVGVIKIVAVLATPASTDYFSVCFKLF